MSNFYTNIEIVNNTYVGTVYNSSNNESVYRTQSYTTQAQAIKDVNAYIKNNTAPQKPAITVNTIQMQPTGPIVRGRCCGR